MYTALVKMRVGIYLGATFRHVYETGIYNMKLILLQTRAQIWSLPIPKLLFYSML